MERKCKESDDVRQRESVHSQVAMRVVLVWLSIFLSTCLALYESDAGKIDWHDSLIGIPRTESVAVAPKFQASSGTSLIVTVSENNVLGVIYPSSGVIAWRQVLDEEDIIGVYESDPNRVVTLSGPGGAYLRSYELKTGGLIFESRLHEFQSGRLFEPHGLGQKLAFAADMSSDIFVLTNSYTIRRIDGLTGLTKWEWTSDDESSSIIYTTMVSIEDTLYAIGLTKSFASLTLAVTSLNAQTGSLVSMKHITSKVTSPSDVLIIKNSDESLPMVAWLDTGIHALALTPELDSIPNYVSKTTYEELSSFDNGKNSFLIGRRIDGSADVFRIHSSSAVLEIVGEFATSDQSAFSYTSGINQEGALYISRVYWSQTLGLASHELLTISNTTHQSTLTSLTFTYEPETHGNIIHHALQIIPLKSTGDISRILLTTSSGAIQLWQQDQLQWNREESLSTIVSVEFVDLPEPKSVETALDGLGLVSRLTRQAKKAKAFPNYISQFGHRFLMGSRTSSLSAEQKQSKPLFRDPFGFRKLIVVSTATRKVFGIDSANGNVVWSKLLDLALSDSTVVPFKLFATAAVTDGKIPEMVLLAHVQHSLTRRVVVAYHFAALTGADLKTNESKTLKGEELFSGAALDAYLTRHGEERSIVIISENQEVHVFPPETLQSLGSSASPIYFSTKSAHHQLHGYEIISKANNTQYLASDRWSISFNAAERIQSVLKRPKEPIASFGKVLGDRSTLYKYLNPHLILVLTEILPASQCSLYLVDGVKGTVVYNVVLPAAGGSCNVHATLTENWLVYHYYDELSEESKGFKIVSVEFYEGANIDDKTRSSESTSYSHQSTNLHTYTQSYLYPFGITAIATTSTKFGITSKDVLVANANFQIQSIPRLFLNPRRPKGKPTAQEQEEWLIQYDPLLPYDPKRVISHNYQVAKINHIATSPALLESTSIVFAYGLDLFLTRVAPSKTFDILSESFNKIQLVLTIFALGLGVAITKPMTRRKQLRQHWYNS